jgi:hypothetical protein
MTSLLQKACHISKADIDSTTFATTTFNEEKKAHELNKTMVL